MSACAPVSVIIPCYRCTNSIARAVDSVINQTLPPTEILLVEDQSEDRGATLSVLHGLQRDYTAAKIQIIELEKNGGPAAARNAGWEVASQPYIAFLDADDAWHPKKLEIQYAWMVEHPEVLFCGHLINVIQPSSSTNLPIGEATARKFNRFEWLLSCRFSTISVMLRRDLPLRFSPEKRYAEDYLLWLRLVFEDYEAWRIELPLAFCFKPLYGVGGLTKEFWPLERGELDVYFKLYKYGRISLFPFLAFSAYSLLKFIRRLMLNTIATRIPNENR